MSANHKLEDLSDGDSDHSEVLEYEDNSTEHKRKRAWQAGLQNSRFDLPLLALSARAVVGPGGVFKTAAIEVLKQEKRLMATGEVTRIALERKLLVCQGKTPDATMASALYTDVRKKGGASPFIKPKSGLFGLRVWLSEPWLLDWLSREGINTSDLLLENGASGDAHGNAAPSGRSSGSSNGRKVMRKAGGGRGGRSGGSSGGRGGGAGDTHVVVQGTRSNVQRVPRVNYKSAFADSDADEDNCRPGSAAADDHSLDALNRRTARTAAAAAAAAARAAAAAGQRNGQHAAAPYHGHAGAAGQRHASAAQGQDHRGADYEHQTVSNANGRPGSAAGSYGDLQQYSNASGRINSAGARASGTAAGANGYEPMQHYPKGRPTTSAGGYDIAMQHYPNGGSSRYDAGMQQQYAAQQGIIDYDGRAGRMHQAVAHSAHHATTQALRAAEDASASILTSSSQQQRQQQRQQQQPHQQQQQQQQQQQSLWSAQQRGGFMAGGYPGTSVTTGANGGAEHVGASAGKGPYGGYSNGGGLYGSGSGIGSSAIGSSAMALAAITMGMPVSTAAALMAPMPLATPYQAAAMQQSAPTASSYGTGPLQNLALMELLRRAARSGSQAPGSATAPGQSGAVTGQGSVHPGGYGGAGPVLVGRGYGAAGGMGPGGGMVAPNGLMQPPEQAYQQHLQQQDRQ